MIRRGSKELFELLKNEGKGEPRKPRPLPGPRPSSAAPDAKPVVALRQEVCVFGAIVLILLLIVTFILGYYKGRNDAISFDYGVPDNVKERVVRDDSPPVPSRPSGTRPSTQLSVLPLKDVVPTVSPGGTTQPGRRSGISSTGRYTLRVWTGTRGAAGRAREVVDFFKSKGFSARSHTDHEGIKILVGRFRSKSDANAVRTRNRVRELIYKGSRSFQDCYFVVSEE